MSTDKSKFEERWALAKEYHEIMVDEVTADYACDQMVNSEHDCRNPFARRCPEVAKERPNG